MIRNWDAADMNKVLIVQVNLQAILTQKKRPEKSHAMVHFCLLYWSSVFNSVKTFDILDGHNEV